MEHSVTLHFLPSSPPTTKSLFHPTLLVYSGFVPLISTEQRVTPRAVHLIAGAATRGDATQSVSATALVRDCRPHLQQKGFSRGANAPDTRPRPRGHFFPEKMN